MKILFFLFIAATLYLTSNYCFNRINEEDELFDSED